MILINFRHHAPEVVFNQKVEFHSNQAWRQIDLELIVCCQWRISFFRDSSLAQVSGMLNLHDHRYRYENNDNNKDSSLAPFLLSLSLSPPSFSLSLSFSLYFSLTPSLSLQSLLPSLPAPFYNSPPCVNIHHHTSTHLLLLTQVLK